MNNSNRRSFIGSHTWSVAMAGTPVLSGIDGPAHADDGQTMASAVCGIAFLGDDFGTVVIGAGNFNVVGRGEQGGVVAELRREYRFGEGWYASGPMIGAPATSEGTFLAYMVRSERGGKSPG